MSAHLPCCRSPRLPALGLLWVLLAVGPAACGSDGAAGGPDGLGGSAADSGVPADGSGAAADAADPARTPDGGTPDPGDLGPDAASGGDAADPGDDTAGGPALAAPVPDTAAAARAFQLYYRERVERAVTAHQRYGVFGDVTFAAAIDKAFVAVDGDEIEIVAGPNDNNHIGTSTWTTWEAYRIFGGRTLALAARRLFDGLYWQEQVTGHPGLTSREVLPGWTRVVDGLDMSVTRTRGSGPFEHPWPADPALEAEMIATFWSGKRYTYREDPSEYLFSWTPLGELESYARTHSFDMLPDYLHISNCCSSFKRTPDDRLWGGAFWGNHNSRDNFPDLGLGFLAAMDAASQPAIDPDVAEAAQRALGAGHRVGDLVQEHGGVLMTVDEWNDYDTLVAGGAVRPHGAPEPQNGDLGSMSSCSMAFLARAISSDGLDAELPTLPLPAALEQALLGAPEAQEFGIECNTPEGPPVCVTLDQAYCGLTWGTMDQFTVLGQPWLEVAQTWDEFEPGKAAELLGSFQNDYDDVVEGMAALVLYAQITGKADLEAIATAALADMTELMRTFAEVVWSSTQPGKQAEQRYEAAIFDAWAGREVVVGDLAGFALAEQRIASLESLLELEEHDTEPAALWTDEEILARVESSLAGEKLDSVVQRYRDSYGDVPPVRRAGDGYEARGFPEDKRPWTPVEVPRHAHVGGRKLLQALPLCRTAPHLLDCTWAIAGCARVDLDADGDVDAEDGAAFATAMAAAAGTECGDANGWCGGADLDRTGAVDATDQAFADAAQGCWYAAP